MPGLAWVLLRGRAFCGQPMAVARGKCSETPLKSGPSSGIFSIAFSDQKHGVILGGDYQKENEADRQFGANQ